MQQKMGANEQMKNIDGHTNGVPVSFSLLALVLLQFRRRHQHPF